jgi:hypothetical protein
MLCKASYYLYGTVVPFFASLVATPPVLQLVRSLDALYYGPCHPEPRTLGHAAYTGPWHSFHISRYSKRLCSTSRSSFYVLGAFYHHLYRLGYHTARSSVHLHSWHLSSPL